jgi:UDP-glucose 4-epimerase
MIFEDDCMIVVTGGSGFLGSHLASHLVETGKDVRIVDISPPPMGVGAEFVRVSILDSLRLSKMFAGADAVVHLAALVDVNASVADPFSDFQVNSQGTLNVLEAARHAGIEKIVYASSAAVYGDPVAVPVKETHPAKPLSPYGLSKLTGERYVLMYNKLYGMKNIAIRPFNIYGQGQSAASPYSGVITKFAEALSEGKQPVIYGDGEQTRDFVHVDDVASAFALALDCNHGFETGINIGSGKQVAILDLLEKMCSAAGKTPNPKFLNARKGDIKRSVADITLARERLGFEPKMQLEQGLTELVR